MTLDIVTCKLATSKEDRADENDFFAVVNIIL